MDEFVSCDRDGVAVVVRGSLTPANLCLQCKHSTLMEKGDVHFHPYHTHSSLPCFGALHVVAHCCVLVVSGCSIGLGLWVGFEGALLLFIVGF